MALRMEEVDRVLERHFPRGLEGAEPDDFEQAEQELARIFEGRVKLHGKCTWVSTRRPRLQCDITLEFGAEAQK